MNFNIIKVRRKGITLGKDFIIYSSFLLIYFLAISLYGQETNNPLPNSEAVIKTENTRFTILTEKIIRMEWQEEGMFEDHASFTFINRNLPKPNYDSRVTKDSVVITTSNFKLRYLKDGSSFNDANLRVSYKKNNQWREWKPSDSDTLNLKGTVRTLDRINGDDIELPDGLISRSGYTFIDDSKRPLFDNSDFKWVLPRPENGEVDWYFMAYGYDYTGLLDDFTKVAGKIPMPPKFAFGYWWSRYWAYTSDEFKDLVNEFENHSIPLEVLVIDMDWHETWGHRWNKWERDQAGEPKGWTGYTWSSTFFPNPDDFLDWTAKKDLKVTLNLHPASGIQPYEEPYKRMAKALGVDPDSKKYLAFDITNRDFSQKYIDLVLKPFEKQGVDFWWLDWQQWSTTTIAGVTPTWWLNYVFFTHMQKDYEERPLIYHRWGGLGNHRYQIGFSGDAVTSWESLAFQPYFTATASNVGYGYWSHDIGGHIQHGNNSELFTRWVQWGAFSPILRTHANKALEAERRIWAYPYPYEKAMREAIWQRYELIPYIYTMARKTYDSGISLMRPMYYSHPEKEEAYQAKDQYMFGEDMLVKPITSKMNDNQHLVENQVWLPEGKWMNWYSGKKIDKEQLLTERFALDEIPVYVRQGAIIPMQHIDDVLHRNQAKENRLVLTVIPGAEGKGQYYEDQGNTDDYQKNAFAWTNFSHQETDKTLTLHIFPAEGNYKEMPKKRSYEIRIPASWPAKQVKVNGREVERQKIAYDGSSFTNIIEISQTRVTKEIQVEVKFPHSIKDPLLDGMAGNIKRIHQAVNILENLLNTTDVINNYTGLTSAPEELIDLGQTGRKLATRPQQAKDILMLFHNNAKQIIDSISSIQAKREVIDQATDVLKDVNATVE